MPNPRRGMADRRHVLVTVAAEHRGDLDTVALHLQAAGLSVADRYPMSGIIAGDVAVADLARVRAVEGIAAVEEEPTFVPR